MSEQQHAEIVHIVGTGPGDPALLTVIADTLIRNADVVLYDCKGVEQLLPLASPGAQVIAVDRSRYQDGTGDREQTAMVMAIREHYQAGKKVVRLKGGDPTLFGGEVDEADVLDRLGIPYRFVPGISAGVAAASGYALPISRKFESDVVVSMIANEIRDDYACFRNVAQLLQHGATLVLYMATENLPGLLSVLREEGIAGSMPVVAVSKVARNDEACIASTLAELAADGLPAGLDEPVVYTIGRFVRVRTAGPCAANAVVTTVF